MLVPPRILVKTKKTTTLFPFVVPPDVSSFAYDESSGYYYDAVTQYYYDANTQYFFDSATKEYLFYHPESSAYLPATMKGTSLEVGDADGKKRGPAGEKVKSAKRIAKDMEKWAKTLNQRKDAAKSNLAPAEVAGNNSTAGVGGGGNNGGTSDVAFSILQKKSTGGSSAGLAGLAGYGSDSEEEGGGGAKAVGSASHLASSGGGGNKAPREEDLVDFAKLACLLCQRQFPSGEKLQK